LAQWISESPVRVVASSETREVYDTKGRLVQPKVRRTYAQFKRGGVPPYALPYLRMVDLHRKPPGQSDEGYVGFYDSEADQLLMGWTDEERALIEEKVDASPYTIRIEVPRLSAPYAKYDEHRRVHGQRKIEHAIKDILEAHEQAGFDVELAIGYEKQEGNSEQVIAALQGLLAPEEESDPLIAA
jgi:hypothetical protein